MSSTFFIPAVNIMGNGCLDEAMIAKMKRGAYLVNTARGKICDRDAVARALQSGQLAGYGGDVWFPQPAPKDHPWRSMPHHGMTPHISGTSLSAQFLKRSLKVALAGAPLVLAVSAAVLILWGSDKWVASAIAIIWGFAFALVPVGWSTWITRSLADQAEKAGSIQVAVIQLANTCGAAVGGVALDHLGLTSPLVISGTLMLMTALLVAGKVKAQ